MLHVGPAMLPLTAEIATKLLLPTCNCSRSLAVGEGILEGCLESKTDAS